MDELVRWLGEQLDEDERIAREAGGLGWSRSEHPWDTAVAIRDSKGERVVCDEGWPSEGQEVHIAEWDPARVLREIEAKRRIVDRFAWLREHGDTGGTEWVIPLLALAYEDRPGYREEWRP